MSQNSSRILMFLCNDDTFYLSISKVYMNPMLYNKYQFAGSVLNNKFNNSCDSYLPKIINENVLHIKPLNRSTPNDSIIHYNDIPPTKYISIIQNTTVIYLASVYPYRSTILYRILSLGWQTIHQTYKTLTAWNRSAGIVLSPMKRCSNFVGRENRIIFHRFEDLGSDLSTFLIHIIIVSV